MTPEEAIKQINARYKRLEKELAEIKKKQIEILTKVPEIGRCIRFGFY